MLGQEILVVPGCVDSQVGVIHILGSLHLQYVGQRLVVQAARFGQAGPSLAAPGVGQRRRWAVSQALGVIRRRDQEFFGTTDAS
jgi:hypothetical protein